jgi:potassium voltage-gated channel Eag-related subfamily H protein 7
MIEKSLTQQAIFEAPHRPNDKAKFNQRLSNKVKHFNSWQLRPTCFIHPRSKYMKRWDIVIMLLLLYTALFTPYEVAFLNLSSKDRAFWMSFGVDMLFLKDIFLSFFLAYDDPRNGALEIDLRHISRNYLKGWFFLDFISIFPFTLISENLDNSNLGDLRIVRVLRLLRLAKLVRITKGVRIFSRWEKQLNMSYSHTTIYRLLLIAVLFMHWIACLWRLIVTLEVGDTICPSEDDLVYDEFGHVEISQPDSWVHPYCGTPAIHHFNLYIVSLYWAVTTVSTIGYGDAANPQTVFERMVGMIAMVSGSGFYAYALGAVCHIIQTKDSEKVQYRAQMDQLGNFFQKSHIHEDLRERLRDYFRHRRLLQQQDNYKNLLELMSPTLRGEVAYISNSHWMQHLPWLGKGSISFITACALVMHSDLYAPMELVEGSYLHVVVRGVAAKDQRIITSGHTWGKDMILSAKHLRYMEPARSISYVETKSLCNHTLDSLLERFPKEKKRIRTRATWLGFRRGMLAHCAHLKELHTTIQKMPGLDYTSITQAFEENDTRITGLLSCDVFEKVLATVGYTGPRHLVRHAVLEFSSAPEMVLQKVATPYGHRSIWALKEPSSPTLVDYKHFARAQFKNSRDGQRELNELQRSRSAKIRSQMPLLSVVHVFNNGKRKHDMGDALGRQSMSNLGSPIKNSREGLGNDVLLKQISKLMDTKMAALEVKLMNAIGEQGEGIATKAISALKESDLMWSPSPHIVERKTLGPSLDAVGDSSSAASALSEFFNKPNPAPHATE